MARTATDVARIRLLLLDVDGVLTDGSIWIGADGSEIKRFHVHDGAGIAAWRRAGNQTAILSGRSSEAVEHRARELGIAPVIQGASSKIEPFEALIAELGVDRSEVCFVGDDLPDIPVLREVGFAVAPANARPEVKAAAHHVTETPGGHGAVREVTELLLAAKAEVGGATTP